MQYQILIHLVRHFIMYGKSLHRQEMEIYMHSLGSFSHQSYDVRSMDLFMDGGMEA